MFTLSWRELSCQGISENLDVSSLTRVNQLSNNNAPVNVNPDPPPPHPGICGAIVGLYHHIGSSLSPQYVGNSRIFVAFVLRKCGALVRGSF